jgi:amidase
MARSVADAAILLGAMEGLGHDPNDLATGMCSPPAGSDYTAFLNPNALRGARIGIPRVFYFESTLAPGDSTPRGGISDDRRALVEEALAVLRQQGAVVVDPADLPTVTSTDPASNLLRWQTCSGIAGAKGSDTNCSIVFKYGMKRDFNAWLGSLGATAPVATLSQLRQWNLAHQQAGSLKYGQAQLDIVDEIDIEQDGARYQRDRNEDLRLSRQEGIDAVMDRFNLDVLLFPAASGASVAAQAGYPSITVPIGFVGNDPNPAFPAGFDARPAPYGVMLTGRACSEPRLIELAYALEQATRKRVPPSLDR